MSETLSSGNVYTRLERIAEMARKQPERVFSCRAPSRGISPNAQGRRRRGRWPVGGGVRARTAGNLESLHDRLKSGRYRAPPVRRVEIPKASGGLRPLGIPTFEDKVLQRAVSMVLEAIYEQDFLDCSYGFRPGRSAHGALEAVWKSTMSMGGAWVVEVEIEAFFDSVDHGQLRSFLDRRVTDGVVRRVIHKWLKAGVMSEVAWKRSERGTPQGGVISPLLANIYLHEVLDVWFMTDVQPRLRGRTRLIRYADDFVIVCEREDDARRVMAVLPKRFGRFGLRLHPEKTRLVRFEPRGPGGGPRRVAEPPTSFDFLGFTHHWGKSRKGAQVVKRKTSSTRFTRALRQVRQWCRAHRHQPVRLQHEKLAAKLRGHYGYFGITGNAPMLERFWYEVRRTWFQWLGRRSNGGARRTDELAKACRHWGRRARRGIGATA